MGSYTARFFQDGTGKLVLWQTPNVPLLGWALFTLFTHLLPTGNWQAFAGYASFGFIFTWSWLEITSGASYFRRTLGVVVLVLSIHSRLT
ncbi:MAG TPA: hypothetical protein VLF40_01890 [Candidatus Saccharimonadales bacterium]|nr:hypothetical protein [Candidatus Saccharimonadales bacterium]